MFSPAALSFPSPPTYSSGSIATFIVDFLVWIVEIPFIGLVILLEDIFNALGGSFGSTISGLFGILTSSFNQTVQALSGFGIFSSILAAIIWGVSLLIILLFIGWAIHLVFTDAEDE